MDHKTYTRMSATHLKGRRFRLVEPITLRGGKEIPAGAVVEFRRKFGGFDIQLPPCRECGVSHQARKVSPAKLELLEPEEESSLEECNPGVGPWLP